MLWQISPARLLVKNTNKGKAEIEASFAREQYELYKANFVSKTFGLASISEYPKGQFGLGDIDSGPVIFGVGFSGTIVSIGTFSKLGDLDLAEQQYKTINAFGFSRKSENEKRYVFGLMPIADAFIAWGRASKAGDKNQIESAAINWRNKFHIFSGLFLLLLWTLLYFRSILTKLKNQRT